MLRDILEVKTLNKRPELEAFLKAEISHHAKHASKALKTVINSAIFFLPITGVLGTSYAGQQNQDM